MRNLFMLILFFSIAGGLFGQFPKGMDTNGKELVFEDDFSSTVLSSKWSIETNDKDKQGCKIQAGQLQLNTEGGITLWYNQPLKGNILIEYDRIVHMDNGVNDRLSDLNQFWMATDPQGKMFKRRGGFREYDSLKMYYVGMGGNYNTTTRMRRYDGMGKLDLLGEYTDSAHLLKANQNYHIIILVKDGQTQFIVNGENYFTIVDKTPFTSGYFAIRSTRSRQSIDNVKIWKLN